MNEALYIYGTYAGCFITIAVFAWRTTSRVRDRAQRISELHDGET